MARVDVSREVFSSASAITDAESDATLIGADGVEITNNDGRTRFLLIGGSAEATLVISTPTTYDTDLAIDDREITVGIDDIALIGPFSPAFYNQTDGKIHVDPKADPADVDEIKILPFI